MSGKIEIPRHGKTPIGAYYSPGIFSDGGGIIIYPGHDGKLHVKIVPPREPVLEQLNVIAGLLAHAGATSDIEVSKQLQTMAETILAKNDSEIGQVIAGLQE